jgi:glucose/arabinose dehydrogenase
MPLRLSALVAALVAFALSAAPVSAALHLTPVGTFDVPVYVTAPPGDQHRVMVVEQGGKIMEIRDGVTQSTPFLDITRDVKSGGEQGLLSMAFASSYATSGRYYVYYTAPRAGDSGGSVITVEEFSPAGRRVVFTVDHPTNSNHNGGQLQFGPDGLLYAGTGDGGSGNDPPNNAQNPGSLLGKLLRIDPRVAGAAPQVYALGLRNPFRYSFDRQTGDLIIGDVGQGRWEEIDFSPAATAPGRNYGWHCREGAHDTPGVTCSAPGAIDPVLEKDHNTTAFRAIIGGYVVRDPTLPELNGRYVYGDNNAPEIRSVTLPGATDDAATGLTVSGLTSFGEDGCGHVYTTAGGGDTRPPAVRIGSLRRQPALRQHGFRLSVRCDELCGATVTGTVRVKGSKRIYVLARAARQLTANKRVKLTLRASHRALRAIRRALRRHRRVTATLSVVASDAAGNAGRASRKVRAR